AVLVLHDDPQAADVIVLDVMLPGRDGFWAAAELRRRKNFVPVLMLTARGRPEDVLKGFESGADDYLPKPFDLSILLARINSLLRRTGWMRGVSLSPASGVKDQPEIFAFAGRTVDFSSLELDAKEQKTHLTLMEAELLRYLIRNNGRAVSRKQI